MAGNTPNDGIATGSSSRASTPSLDQESKLHYEKEGPSSPEDIPTGEFWGTQDAPSRKLSGRPYLKRSPVVESDVIAQESGAQSQPLATQQVRAEEAEQGRPQWAGAPRHGWQSAPAPKPPAPLVKLALVGDRLELLMAPGDVLCVKGSGRLMEIGRAGGFMGHVMVVVSPPRSVPRQSRESIAYRDAWPADAAEIWVVRTVESTRSQQGLYGVDSLLFVQRDTGKLMLFGEVTQNDEISVCDEPEPVELWQSPGELRAQLRMDLMVDVVMDIKATLTNWSAATAARAVMWQGSRTLSGGRAKVLDDMMSCWAKEPICTSVVIMFWQMYLCRLAHVVQGVNPADMILRFMPLKADRILPGQLLKTMREHGFVALSRVPKVFKSVVVPAPPAPPPQPQLALHPAGHQHSPEQPLNIGERVAYWSESVSKWVDAVVLKHHLDPQGKVVCYDLDVKPMADGGKIRRTTKSPCESELPALPDGVLPPVSSRRPNEPPARSPRDAFKDGSVTPPSQPADAPAHAASSREVAAPAPSQPASRPSKVESKENDALHVGRNAVDLSALIAAAVNEGWFSPEDIEGALLASRGKKKKSSKGETKVKAGPKSSRDAAVVVAGPKCLITV